TVSGPALSDASVQAALERLSAALAVSLPLGLRSGAFTYVNTASVQIAEGVGGDVRVEIDGVVLSQPAPLNFAWANLETGVEANSTWYYCYVRNVAGTLTPVISVTPPNSAVSTKIGYHPVIADARFVQAFYNDSQGNIAPFDELPDKTVILRSDSTGGIGGS